MVGLLIRHGHADAVEGWLSGRRDGVALSAQGRAEAERLRQALRWTPLSAVYSSPLGHAVETAQPLARDRGLDVEVRPALTDVDFGDWTGRAMDELATDPAWQSFNRDRTRSCPPRGEALALVQQRIVDELMKLARTHAGETIAIVTHAEPIRCALAAFGGSSLDAVMAVEINGGHVSPVGIAAPHVRRVLGINMPADDMATV